MDNPKDIKRRLIVCLFFYDLFKKTGSHLELNSQYFGKIYVIDQQTGDEKDPINLEDYSTKKVLERVRARDSDTLSLLN